MNSCKQVWGFAMRIEGCRLRAMQAALAGTLCLLTGCPGELPNKAEFEAYAAAHGEAGAATNEAGTSSGTAGDS